MGWVGSILLLFWFLPFSARALTVSPPKIELTGDPGKTISGSFLLINEQEETKKFYTTFENFEAQGETGTPKFTAAVSGLGSWISAASTVTLKSGEQKEIPFTIAIPTNAEPGGHFAGIFLGTSPPELEGGGQVSVGAKVGVLILLRVSGAMKEGVNLLAFKPVRRFVSSLPAHFFYRLQNGGADRLKPEGEIVVRNIVGYKSARFPSNKNDSNVLPYSIRRFEVMWTGSKEADASSRIPAPVAPEGFWGHVKYEWQYFALGPYSAKLSFTYGKEHTLVSAKTYFFVFPWHLLIVLIPSVLLILWGGKKGISRYNKWIIAQARAAKEQ